MGLDMYLTAKKYVGYGNDTLKEKLTEAVESPFGDVKEVSVEAMYWRKANAIHKWFVDNVQSGDDDCEEYYVDSDKLTALLTLCKSVLDNRKQAAKLLPPQSGFFFGETDITDWYFNDIANTVEQLEKILSADTSGWEFYYRASW